MLERLRVDDPYILETHGGKGRVWQRLYCEYSRGGVIEKDPGKAEFLARQRPTWAVYEGCAEKVLATGLFRDRPVEFMDVDPYGSPWPTIEGFFLRGDRQFAPRMGLAVNDGLRQNTRIKGSWQVGALKEAVRKYGNDNIRRNYLAICEEKIREIASKAGYRVEWWRGYYCGNLDDMTHYAALLSLEEPDA